MQNEHHQISAAAKNSNTQRTENKTTDVVIHLNSRRLLKMDVLMSETCWAHNKWNKITSDIKLVFHSSTIAMMHGPINIRFFFLIRSPIFWQHLLPFYISCHLTIRSAVKLTGTRFPSWNVFISEPQGLGNLGGFFNSLTPVNKTDILRLNTQTWWRRSK